jgi:cytochrome c oxidase subunit 2
MVLLGRRVAILVAPLSVGACERAPMTYMRTFGPAADPVTSLGWGLTVICCLVILIVGGLLLTATLRARATQAALSSIPIARPGGGLRWIYFGTGISTAVLFGLVVWTMFTLAAIAHSPGPPVFTIEIRAHQWWWEARYLDDANNRSFVTANELHIPVGKPVQLRLIGDDVIHSFWIPALAGKTDVIPGQTNVAWIQANTPGTYRGQCTEYCGLQHAHMAEFVTADSAADFGSWWTQQLNDAPTPSGDTTLRGESVFLARCAACHTVRGTGAGGILGPDLTHIMSRHTLGAGTVPNDPEHLNEWITDAQAVKPGCRMPTLDLPQPDLAAVTAYVQTLH